MASVFSTLSNIGEAASALSDLAFGAAGGVVLDDFSFADFEVPEYISAPGSHQLIVHKLPGGERVIDAMGDDPGDISWSGTFLDNDPASRAQTLEKLRASGKTVGLQWGSYYYTVIVRSFEQRTYYSRVQYSISCCALRNEATARRSDPPDLTGVVNGDIISAVLAAPAEIAPILKTAQGAVGVLGKLVPGSPALAQASASLGSASGAMTGLSLASGSTLAAITATSQQGQLVNGAKALALATSSAGTLAQSMQSGFFIGRANRNLI